MADSSHTVLGFDFGMKRIGVAVGQTLTGTTSPLQTLNCINGNPNWNIISHLIAEWSPLALIVGLPFTADGNETMIISMVKIFIYRLKDRYQLPVYTIDEYLSSHEAQSRLESHHFNQQRHRHKKTQLLRAKIDSLAAQVILQTWLTEYYTKHKNSRA